MTGYILVKDLMRFLNGMHQGEHLQVSGESVRIPGVRPTQTPTGRTPSQPVVQSPPLHSGMEREVKMFFGLAPYNEPGNVLCQDGYFAVGFRQRWGITVHEARKRLGL